MDARLHRLLERPEVAIVRDLARNRSVPIILVGGAVRDALLDRAPHDFDFAVQGDAVGLGRAVANALSADFYVMDAERGTARVLMPNTVLDFAVCRGVTWRDDLRARDFTLNAIAIDPMAEAVLDQTGGIADLAAGQIRVTSDHALADDPLRALRAVRLKFALDMTIEPKTLALVSAIGGDILRPSAERMRDEFFDILGLPNAAQATRMLDEVGLLTHVAPEIEPMRSQAQSAPHRFTVLEHTWQVMAALDALVAHVDLAITGSARQSIVEYLQSNLAGGRTVGSLMRFAALMHDCAKPDTFSVDAEGRMHFYTHERLGADMAAARARALKLSGDEVSWIRAFIVNHMRPNQMARMPQPPTPRTLARFFRDSGECAPLLALFAVADCWGKRGGDTNESDCRPSHQIAALLIQQYYTLFEKSVAPAPLLTGQELIALGVPQGPRIGAILRAVREAQMAGEIETHAQALALVDTVRHQP
jgi:tRNA nucleotidyltransferase/poly(A) polymerase